MTEATRGLAGRRGPAALRRRRAAAQLLGRPSGLGPADMVRHLVAVQAQDARGARLALRARAPGLRAADVDGCEDLVVSWLMRGTLHLVHRADLPWLHAATVPPRRGPAAARLRQLGVDEAAAARGVAVVREVLADGPRTRAQLREVLAGAGVPVAGQALGHVLMRATLDGVAVRDLRGTFRALALPPVAREDALRRLARRYAVAHPEAGPADLARWAGLPRRDVRPVGPLDPPADEPAAAPPRLLPPFDPYMLGWRDRAFAVPDTLAARVAPGGGMLRATAVLDGRVVGTWTVAGGRVTLHDGADPAVFAAEAADVKRSLVS